MFVEVPLFQQTSPALKNTWSCASTSSSLLCLHNNSNDLTQASAGDVINLAIVLNISSLVIRGGTEKIAASPSS